ncbi:MAG TPA: PIN domain-containing protein [Jatrophihabitantaceae bacterium]|nr:PIN domain-containing protein [Jatrophihabitantaceae bacterium]
MPNVGVVVDVTVLVSAVLGGQSAFETWPVLPPRTENPAADCLGVVNDAQEFALWLSPHILVNTSRVLLEQGQLQELVAEFLQVLSEIAEASGGGVLEPARTVFGCPDFEDNLILGLVAEVGAVIVVSNDTDLTSMSPWRATPILRPEEFASRVDATRRARRRAGR